MISRTIIAIEPNEDALQVRLKKSPAQLPGADYTWRRLDCDPDTMPAWTDDDAVRAHGRLIFQKLSTHPSVQKAIEWVLAAAPEEEKALYFSLTAQDAERLCWEAIYSEDCEFLALDRRWPIARMTESLRDASEMPREFEPPLRVLALISAANIAGQEREWQELRDAVVHARAELPIHVTVMSGTNAVIDAVKADIAGGLPDVVVEPLSDDREALSDRLLELRPHIVHFFSHGRVAAGVSQLELATLLDELMKNPSGSLRLRIGDLKSFQALRDSWLVTLNCCQGAQASERLHSLAHQIVLEIAPAAIGMLEPIDAADAHVFTRNLYQALFDEIVRATRALPPGGTVPVQWCRVLQRPRRVVSRTHDDDPNSHREWTLPVLYVRQDPFTICAPKSAGASARPASAPARDAATDGGAGVPVDAIAPAAAGPAAAVPPAPAAADAEPSAADVAAARVRAREVAAVLRALPPATPVQVRQQLLALLDDVPEAWRPNLHGAFPLTDPIEATAPPDMSVPIPADGGVPRAAVGANG
jgi:hypothetical protein